MRDTRLPLKNLITTTAAALLILTSAAFGQTGADSVPFAPPAMMAEAFVPDFLRRDVQVLTDHFTLDDEQQAIVDALYTDYEEKFVLGSTDVRNSLDSMKPTEEQRQEMRMHNHTAIKRRLEELVDQMRELQETGIDESPEVFEQLKEQARELRARMQEGDAAAMEMDLLRQIMVDIDAAVAQWEIAKAQLYESFLSDVKLVLSDAQQELWPAFERKLRRMKTLYQGVLSGESTDVLALVARLDLSSDEMVPIAPTLSEFERVLDTRLQQRNDYLRLRRADRAAIMQAGDVAAAEALAMSETTLRVAVRDTNEQYARTIADGLGEPAGPEFLDSYQKASYPSAFRRSRASRAFDAILQLPQLESALLESLDAVVAEYEAQLGAGRDQLITLTRQYEPMQYRQRFIVQVARVAGDEPIVEDDNPLLTALASMRDSEQGYIERALSILPEEQILGLPAFVRMGTAWSEHSSPIGEGRARTPQTQEERRAFSAQFDVNGDGELDVVEREQLRRALQELYKKEAQQPQS